MTDRRCSTEFKQANDAVIAALGDYKKWLQNDLLKRSNGEFAFGEDTYRKKLAADEMIDVPLDELLAIAETRSEEEPGGVRRDARKRSTRSARRRRCWPRSKRDHPPADKLLSTTQAELDAHRPLHDRPPHRHDSEGGAGAGAGDAAVPARHDDRVDGHPGSVRDGGDRGVLQHDAAGSEVVERRDRTSSCASGTTRAITNVSVHEVWPGHYLQFLYAKQLSVGHAQSASAPRPTPKAGRTTASRWCIDEGFHADDPRYRLAQLQDALLRDARFIVGIRMHTQGHDDARRRRSSS